jgi:hypothetical protein
MNIKIASWTDIRQYCVFVMLSDGITACWHVGKMPWGHVGMVFIPLPRNSIVGLVPLRQPGRDAGNATQIRHGAFQHHAETLAPGTIFPDGVWEISKLASLDNKAWQAWHEASK